MNKVITEKEIQEIISYCKSIPVPFRDLEPICVKLSKLPNEEGGENVDKGKRKEPSI